MLIKTSELSGAALDWAVAKATGELVYEDGEPVEIHVCCRKEDGPTYFWTCEHPFGYEPSTNWEQGGPLLDEFDVWLSSDEGVHSASVYPHVNEYIRTGLTKLTAACRAIVAEKLGDEVEVPDELLGQTVKIGEGSI